MAENRAEPTSDVVSIAQGDPLPQSLRARFNGQLDAETVIAWAEYDLDEENRYVTRYAVLTDRSLLLVGADEAPPRELRIADVEEAKVVEGLGVDHLNVIAKGERVAELRY